MGDRGAGNGTPVLGALGAGALGIFGATMGDRDAGNGTPVFGAIVVVVMVGDTEGGAGIGAGEILIVSFSIVTTLGNVWP